MDHTAHLDQIMRSADMVLTAGDFTSATILAFKASFAAIDVILLREKGRSPKDHTERFRMLQASYPDLYRFLDKYFSVYRESYTLTIPKKTCEEVFVNVRAIVARARAQG